MELQYINIPGDIVSRADLSPGAKLMFGRVRILRTGKIITAYVAQHLGMKADDAEKYLWELVKAGVIDKDRMDATYSPYSPYKENMNTPYFPYKDCKKDANKEDNEIKGDSLSEMKEKEKKETYLPQAEASAKLRELKKILKMKKFSAARAERVSPDENRERQKQAMRSIIAE